MLICILLNGRNFNFSIAKAVLPTTLLSLNRTKYYHVKFKSQIMSDLTYCCYFFSVSFFIYFTSYLIVHNLCNLFLSLLHTPSSTPFAMLFWRYHWCICSLLICILVNRKNFSISWEGCLCCAFVQGIFGATGLIHVVVCKCAPMPYSNIWIYCHFKGRVSVRFERKILALPRSGGSDLVHNCTMFLCYLDVGNI